MKKMLATTCLVVMLAMLLCTAALASQPADSGIYGADTSVMSDFMTAQGASVAPAIVGGYGAYYPAAQRFTVTYSGAQTGEEYFLAVVAGSAAPGGADTVYVDQARAASASISFRVFPITLREGLYSIYLTGGGRTLSDGALATFRYYSLYVDGTAVSWSTSNDASYFLYDAAVDDVSILADMALEAPQLALDRAAVKTAATSTSATGWQEQSFRFREVDAGTYKLAVSKSGCRTQILAADVSRGSCTVRVNLLSDVVGDMNGTGHRDATDMQNLYAYLSTDRIEGSFQTDRGYYQAAADVNGSGDINILDYQYLYELLKAERP